ncbi:MAG: O-acetyl-ADP-ribose deacetylase [Saprospiraceae bacterium]|nr:O-acetyl-ADP-ribose deacetylase [Saprospiraceae bacterium]
MTTRLTLEQGDITKIAFDVIVNAANSSLLGGGGVDGAIHRAGGPKILEECMEIRASQGGCKTGEAVMTTGGSLPARFVIHTVGPVYSAHDPAMPTLLGNCYRNSLRLAVSYGLKTVAFPNISTGVYGYPKAAACEVALLAVRAFLSEHDGKLEEVRFVCFDEENFALYSERLSEG